MSAMPDSTLANPEQRIADLERQLAEFRAERDEYKAERDEALQRETATAEVLRVINSSSGDLAPVFDAILEKAMRLCEAAFGMMGTIDGDELRTVSARGLPNAFVEFRKNNPPVHGSGTARARILAGERVVHILDLRNEEFYRTADPNRRAVVDLGGARTVLLVALEKDGVILGHIGVYRQEVQSFSEKQIALLQNFAAQAVIAMENARLLTETREALEQQTATAEVLQVINSSPGTLAPVFDAILAKALLVCAAEFGTFYTFDGEEFHSVANRGAPTELEGTLRGHFVRLIDGETIVHIPDLTDTDMYRNGSSRAVTLADIGGARTTVWLAVRTEQELLGVLVIYRQEVRPFSDKEIALLKNFAAQAVIAMENARLITETREALEQQTATAEVLQVINSSPGDLAPVFEAMLDKAHSLCGVDRGALVTYDGERFLAVATRGMPERYAEVLSRPYRADPGTPNDRLLRGERFVHIPDLATAAALAASGQAGLEAGSRTVLLVALRNKTGLLGYIGAHRTEVRPFADKEIALLENFAAQAVIAMENARLLDELHQRTNQVAELNRGLQARVAEQVEELGRVGRLKRFLAPQLAELIVSQGDEKILESHRREIVVVFCDLRGYTAFTETAEPEEVLKFLREYHGALGPLVSQFEGTLDQFSGDGIMVFFNDPVPCPDPAERAVKMAMAMREEAGRLITVWRRHGCELGFGAGIAQGYATLGQIGFSERSGYTAIGTVCNLAARLCAEAKDGQILVSSHIAEAVEAVAKLEDLGNLELKGLRRPVAAFNVAQSISAADARPNLTVVASGPGA